jgi:hypothetical protein
MSEGPIKREREAHKPPRVSTADSYRKCYRAADRGYCGRRSAPLVTTWEATTCADCRAAARADSLHVDATPPS